MSSMQSVFFGKSVKHQRVLRKLSRRELSLITGIEEKELTQIEQGRRLPDEAAMLRLITQLKLTPDWVFALNPPDESERMDSIIRLIRCFDGQELVRIERFISGLAGEAAGAAH